PGGDGLPNEGIFHHRDISMSEPYDRVQDHESRIVTNALRFYLCDHRVRNRVAHRTVFNAGAVAIESILDVLRCSGVSDDGQFVPLRSCGNGVEHAQIEPLEENSRST